MCSPAVGVLATLSSLTTPSFVSWWLVVSCVCCQTCAQLGCSNQDTLDFDEDDDETGVAALHDARVAALAEYERSKQLARSAMYGGYVNTVGDTRGAVGPSQGQAGRVGAMPGSVYAGHAPVQQPHQFQQYPQQQQQQHQQQYGINRVVQSSHPGIGSRGPAAPRPGLPLHAHSALRPPHNVSGGRPVGLAQSGAAAAALAAPRSAVVAPRPPPPPPRKLLEQHGYCTNAACKNSKSPRWLGLGDVKPTDLVCRLCKNTMKVVRKYEGDDE